MAAALKQLGFLVIQGRDLDKTRMDRTIQQFAEALNGAEMGLFFYAGHGLQVGSANYLVTIDAKLSTTHALDFEMVRLDLVQRVMESATQTDVIFLDACRDNRCRATWREHSARARPASARAWRRSRRDLVR